MKYVRCHNIKGNTIAKYIIDTVTNVGLDTLLCRSQTYDAAENISGKEKSASNQFCKIVGNGKTLFFSFFISLAQFRLIKSTKGSKGTA